MEITEAIILCGGRGKRLRSITNDRLPKGLIVVHEKPILEWEIMWLQKYGVNHIILAIGHLGNQIEQQFGSEFHGVKLSYNHEKQKLGSGGAIKEAARLLTTDEFYILNGDILCNADLHAFSETHRRVNTKACMFLVQLVSRFGLVEYDGDLITRFMEKPPLPYFLHGGLDILHRSLIERFPDVGQMEDTIFVDIANEGDFAIHKSKEGEFWQSIDSEKDLDIAKEKWVGIELP